MTVKNQTNAEHGHNLNHMTFLSDHVLRIQALRSQISSGTFATLAILIVSTF